MRILLTGGSGQVGWEMRRELSLFGEVLSPTSAQLDLSRPSHTRQAVLDSGARLVVNCGAYTAVDKAEAEPEQASAINHLAVASLAEACRETGASLVHFSTDYIFGDMSSEPMGENHSTKPLGVYGNSKLQGELAIRQSGCAHLIFRTSWVYASRGKNFLLTMLRLAAQGKPLRIVNDQWGAPTSARLIAGATGHCLARAGLIGGAPSQIAQFQGTYNLCAAGYTTWHGFGVEIFRLRERITGRTAPWLEPISTEQFPTPAQRQTNSRLRLGLLQTSFGLNMPGWQQALEPVLTEALNDSPDQAND